MKINRINAGYAEYVSPEMECVNVDAEGVLCSSTEDLLLDEEWGELFNL
jgi:hypothetical protein